MAVAPSSWTTSAAGVSPRQRPPRPTPASPAPPRPALYHHVILHLLVDAGQPVLPTVLGQAGLEPPARPLLVVLLPQVLVGQHQGPEPLPRVLLEAEPRKSSLPLPNGEGQNRSTPRPDPRPAPTFRWSVVVLSSSWVECWILSSRMVSAPLQ